MGNLLTQSINDGTTNNSQTTTWSYYASGLVASEISPNGAITSYQYDSAGNLTHRTNALSQVDTYTHDGAGRVLTHTAPNGLATQYTYDARGRLLTLRREGLAATYTYRPSGQLASATSASGYAVSYQYDAAQRLTGWSDNRGASASYTLDAMGNRVHESITQQGQPIWQLARTINSLNRVQTVTIGGNSAHATAYGYDANGDLIETAQSVDGALQSATLGLDALRRVQSVTNAANATAKLQYNALDAVTQARDYKNTVTNYQRDAQGNATREANTDAGVQRTTYDALGLPQRSVDAMGRITRIVRDALGRPTRIRHTDNGSDDDPEVSVLRYDLPGNAYNIPEAPNASQGHLSELRDPEAITRYRRDALGRTVRKAQLHTSGEQYIVNTSYIPAGQGGAGETKAINYPSGTQLVHQYDATGQLTALRWNGQPLIKNLTWNALGQPTGWQWHGFVSSPGSNNALKETRQYTSAGQLAQSALLDLTWDSAGRLRQIKQQHMLPGATQPQQTSITSAYTYDATGRLTASAHSGPPGAATLSDTLGPNATGYSYDANGNRTQAYYSKTTQTGTATTERTYQHTANRLLGYHQIHTPAGASAGQHSDTSYSHDATGAVTAKDNGTYLHYGPDARLQRAGFHADPGNIQAVHYRYNALGQRIAKIDQRMLTSTTAITQHTVYADDGIGSTVLGQYSNHRSPNSAAPAGENDSTEIIYLPTAGGPMPVAAQINGHLYAIHSDHLNTPRRLTNEQGQVTWQWLVSGLGEAKPTMGATGYTQNQSGTAYSEAVTFDLRYPGQQWDEETQLSYNLNRYYDPETGRYVQADPIGLDGGWNRFAYANGSPLMFTDPKGLQVIIVTPRPSGGRVDPDFPPGVGPNHQSDSVLQELIEREANRREYKNACEEPPPPGLNDCERAKWELKKWRSCKALREANTNKWWGGEDTRHNVQMMTDIEINISRAERAVRRICKENCP